MSLRTLVAAGLLAFSTIIQAAPMPQFPNASGTFSLGFPAPTGGFSGFPHHTGRLSGYPAPTGSFSGLPAPTDIPSLSSGLLNRQLSSSSSSGFPSFSLPTGGLSGLSLPTECLSGFSLPTGGPSGLPSLPTGSLSDFPIPTGSGTFSEPTGTFIKKRQDSSSSSSGTSTFSNLPSGHLHPTGYARGFGSRVGFLRPTGSGRYSLPSTTLARS